MQCFRCSEKQKQIDGTFYAHQGAGDFLKLIIFVLQI